MEEKFKIKQREINKQYRIILLTTLACFAFMMSHIFIGLDNMMLISNVVLSVLNIPEWVRKILLSFGSLVITNLPIVITLLCHKKTLELNKESKKLQEEYVDYMCKKGFEENRYKVETLLEEFKDMPRKELIYFLNRTKDEIIKAEKNNKYKCETLDILMLNYLQDGLEDILFPPIVEENQGYSRTRKKEYETE